MKTNFFIQDNVVKKKRVKKPKKTPNRVVVAGPNDPVIKRLLKRGLKNILTLRCEYVPGAALTLESRTKNEGIRPQITISQLTLVGTCTTSNFMSTILTPSDIILNVRTWYRNDDMSSLGGQSTITIPFLHKEAAQIIGKTQVPLSYMELGQFMSLKYMNFAQQRSCGIDLIKTDILIDRAEYAIVFDGREEKFTFYRSFQIPNYLPIWVEVQEVSKSPLKPFKHQAIAW